MLLLHLGLTDKIVKAQLMNKRKNRLGLSLGPKQRFKNKKIKISPLLKILVSGFFGFLIELKSFNW